MADKLIDPFDNERQQATKSKVIESDISGLVDPFDTEMVASEQSQQKSQLPDIRKDAKSIVGAGFEPLRSVVTGMAAEPLAGIAGLASLPFGSGRATENIAAIRDKLTYKPESEEGQKALSAFAETVEPVISKLSQAEEGLGDAGYESGGPILGAIGKTAPTAALTALGLPKVRSGLKSAGKTVQKSLEKTKVKKLLGESTPSTSELKQTARGIYRELDNSGATINSSSVNRLGGELQSLAKKEGFNRRIHPKVSAALDEINDSTIRSLTVSEVDILRKVTRASARSLDPDEARLGSILVEKIDDFMDNLGPNDFVGEKAANVGPRFKEARQLWSRAKKSELIEDAIETAKNQASGFENGIRVQFRSIINNKKKSRGFSSEELDAMKKVVRGGTAENMAKAIGKFGFSEGQASGMLLSSLGVAGGAAIGGAPGAVAVPLIGQVSKSLAQKLTRNNAAAANLIARAGKDGSKVVDAYIKSVPKASRNVSDLTELLLRPEVSIKKLKALSIPENATGNAKIVADAVYFAALIKSQQNKEDDNRQQ